MSATHKPVDFFGISCSDYGSLVDVNDDETVKDFDITKLEHQKHAALLREDFKFNIKPRCSFTAPSTSHAIIPTNGNDESALNVVRRLQQKKSTEATEKVRERDQDGSLLQLRKIYSMMPEVMKMTPDEIVDLLCNSVLFDQDDIVAINKPFRLPSMPGPKHKLALSKLLSLLKIKLSPAATNLHLLHRLDCDTTGVLLLARTAKKATEIKYLMDAQQIKKKYWCITKGVPQQTEATIDVPLYMNRISGRFKTLPAPERDANNSLLVRQRQQTDNVRHTVTEYKVLRSGSKCALLECTIMTGIRHQIRSHLGYGLSCPILGDHKYSDFNDYVPQRLSQEVLHKIGIRASKSRHLPLYLHAKEVHIPDVRTGQLTYINAPLPKSFLWMMNRLKLQIYKLEVEKHQYSLTEAALTKKLRLK